MLGLLVKFAYLLLLFMPIFAPQLPPAPQDDFVKTIIIKSQVKQLPQQYWLRLSCFKKQNLYYDSRTLLTYFLIGMCLGVFKKR
jgi:hypothetical protein